MAEQLLTAEQVARMLQVHHLTVLKLIKQKKIRAVKVGRVYRILPKAVDHFLKKYTT